VRRGFTLVELLVVIAILGITSAAVVPAFARATRDDAVTRAARDFERVVASARETALTRAVRVRVTIVPETGRYWVQVESASDLSALDSGVFALSGGVRFQSPVPRPSVAFDPLGVADGDSLLVLGPTGAMALVIDRWTGEAHVQAR